MDFRKKRMSTADLAAGGSEARDANEMRGRGDDQVVGRSARDAAETFVRNDVGQPEATDRARPDSPQAPRDTVPPPAGRFQEASRPDRPSRPMLFPHDESDRFRTEWTEIQTGFVDSPRQAVERADALIATVMQRLASSFASERATLEQQWDRGNDVTTEDLRVTLQRYRTFFDRLLSF